MAKFCVFYQGFVGSILLAALLLPAHPASAAFQKGLSKHTLSRLDPQSESTSTLIKTTRMLLKNNQLKEAVPFMQEVLVRLQGDEEKKAVQTRAYTMFTLAGTRMKLGDFFGAAEGFVQFVNEYDSDPQLNEARIMAAQCFTMVENWERAELHASDVLDDRDIDTDTKLAAAKLVGESRYRMDQWQEALVPLSTLFRETMDEQVRSSTAVMLVTCFVRLNDFGKLFEFLPHCDNDARFDVGLNLALLESGDEHYKREEFQKSLVLYRLVIRRADLIRHYEELVKEIKATITPFIAGTGESMYEHEQENREKGLELKRKARHLEVLKNLDDYDTDVALRIAQAYSDLNRNWPAFIIYKHVYETTPADGLAQQARFSAFGAMLDEKEWDAALREGYAYINDRPDGDYIDDITLNLLQLHMQLEQLDRAFAIGTRALKLSPKHKHIDQVNYLLGFIKFLQLDYEESLTFFGEVLKRWPDSKYYESAEYWNAMSRLFLSQYDEAVVGFQGYLSNPKYKTRRYEEDATYRLGIAQYGTEDYEDSEKTFRWFTEHYPDSQLLSEAYSMLGDMRAVDADMIVALDFYRLAIESAVNMPQRNYATFQTAKAYELDDRWTDIIELMVNYTKQWGIEADFAEACRWQGISYKAMNQYERALAVYFRTIDQVGDQAELTDVDLILNEIVSDYTNDELVTFRLAIKEQLDGSFEKARDRKQTTLALRYETILAKISTGANRDAHIQSIVKSKNIPAAGPLTLTVIAQEALNMGELELVHEAYDRFMSNFKISNNMLYIMIANLDALVAAGEYQDAIALSEDILLKFGHSQSVAKAWITRGGAYRAMKDYEGAIATYNYLLGIREWRGPLTPEAHYWLGICKQAQGNHRDAYAHFQRIYVLYEEYTEWVARAYTRSVECLKELGETEYVIRTYQEMLQNEAIAATPEGKAARIELEKLQPASAAL